MSRNFAHSIKADAVYGVLSTTAETVYSDKVDLANYEGVQFLAAFKSTGASTGTCTFTVVGTDTSTAASTSYSAISGASVSVAASTTANDKRLCGIDCIRPQYRYVKAKLVKQAGILLNSVVALKYGSRYEPAPASTTYAAATAAASFDVVIEGT